jgi:hypothetical protein
MTAKAGMAFSFASTLGSLVKKNPFAHHSPNSSSVVFIKVTEKARGVSA